MTWKAKVEYKCFAKKLFLVELKFVSDHNINSGKTLLLQSNIN